MDDCAVPILALVNSGKHWLLPVLRFKPTVGHFMVPTGMVGRDKVLGISESI